MTKDELLRKGFKLAMMDTNGSMKGIIVIENDELTFYGQPVKRATAINQTLSKVHSSNGEEAVTGARDLYALLFGDKIVGNLNYEVKEPLQETTFAEKENVVSENVETETVDEILEDKTFEMPSLDDIETFKEENNSFENLEETKVMEMENFTSYELDEKVQENYEPEATVQNDIPFDINDFKLDDIEEEDNKNEIAKVESQDNIIPEQSQEKDFDINDYRLDDIEEIEQKNLSENDDLLNYVENTVVEEVSDNVEDLFKLDDLD